MPRARLTFVETPSGRRLPDDWVQTARDGGKRSQGLGGPMAIRDRFHADARSRCCAGERHVALITADLFAVLLGQRDIEHQDEHRRTSPLSTTVY